MPIILQLSLVTTMTSPVTQTLKQWMKRIEDKDSRLAASRIEIAYFTYIFYLAQLIEKTLCSHLTCHPLSAQTCLHPDHISGSPCAG